MRKPNKDPIRIAWEARRYEQCTSLLRSGALPTPASLRSMWVPKRLGPSRDSLNAATGPFFAESLARMAALAPHVLAPRQDLAADMIINGSLRLVAGILCSWQGRLSVDTAHPNSWEANAHRDALSALFELQPAMACSKLRTIVHSHKGRHILTQSSEPL